MFNNSICYNMAFDWWIHKKCQTLSMEVFTQVIVRNISIRWWKLSMLWWLFDGQEVYPSKDKWSSFIILGKLFWFLKIVSSAHMFSQLCCQFVVCSHKQLWSPWAICIFMSMSWMFHLPKNWLDHSKKCSRNWVKDWLSHPFFIPF